jgi:hypothetical protein
VAAKPQGFISDATLDHQTVHSESTRQRMDLVLAAVEKALTSENGKTDLRIVEAGTVSAGFTRKLATLAAKYGASLIVVEPRENAQRNLEIAFEDDAHVRVLKKDAFATLPAFDLAVSASDTLFTLIDEDGAIRNALRVCLQENGALVAATNAPTVFSDFAFGLTESWFARTQAVEFPIGKLATVTQWQKDLTDLGLRNISVEDRELSHGNIITVEARGGQFTEITQAADTQPAAAATPVLVLHEGSVSSLQNTLPSGKDAIQASLIQVQLTGDFEADKDKIAEAIAGLNEKPVRAVYLSSAAATDRSQDSAALQNRVLSLSAFAEALRQFYAHAEPAADQRPRLVIAAPGGAPVTLAARDRDVSGSSVNSGLWAFARVLQNEYDFLDIHSLDFTGPKAGAGNQLAAAISMLDDASGNREWLLDGTSGILSEIRAVPGPVDQSLRKTTGFKAATIRQRVSSQVGSIAWEQSDIPQAGPDDVVVAVAATGLNFRDVMWAMGLLPEEALEDGFAGATIGMELSGHVVAIGSGIKDLSVGDAVMAIAPAAFSTHVVVSRSGVARLPETVSPVAAATVPVAFLTAYYAMIELGRIRPGETILIHGAAGGVGLAALQVAKLAGAKVIATAGTREKRRFLKMLGADHVFDSRGSGAELAVCRSHGTEPVAGQAVRPLPRTWQA